MARPPILSVAVPTYNRCELLEYCLDRHLEAFSGFSFPYEIVVSDNASTDATVEMVSGKVSEGKPIRLFCRRSTDATANHVNAFRKCRGEIVTYLADDDSILAPSLAAHVDRLLEDVECAGLYTDWIAYDDDRGAELHRYFPPEADGRFTWQDRHRFVEHVLHQRLLPEIGIWRRSAFVQSCSATKLQYPYLLWCYGLLRSGAVVFNREPFYREHRVVAARFSRSASMNSSWALGMIGDSMRLAIENLVCQLMLDSNVQSLPTDSLDSVRRAIDGWLHARVDLEISRAIQRRDWIAAVELRRRLALWYGAAPLERHEIDLQSLTIPASLQRLHELRLALGDLPNLVFVSSALSPYASLYRAQYPGHTTQVVASLHHHPFDPSTSLVACLPAEYSHAVTAFGLTPGHVVDFLALLNDCRVGLVPNSLTPSSALSIPA